VLEFSAVLEEVASRSRERSPHVARPIGLFDLPFGNYAHRGVVTAAYAEAPHAPALHSDAQPPLDLSEFERALNAAKTDARRLRDLRRRIAWALHPDRNTTRELAAALACFNARLDAALAEKR
jgi:hypothetical protein